MTVSVKISSVVVIVADAMKAIADLYDNKPNGGPVSLPAASPDPEQTQSVLSSYEVAPTPPVLAFATKFPVPELTPALAPEAPPAPAPAPVPEAPEAPTPAAEPLPAPAPTPPEPADTLTAGTLDKEGLPWDKRIHSGGQTFLASGKSKGCWKLIRGVDPILVAKVKTELRGTNPAPTPAPAAPAPAAPAPAAPGLMTWPKLVEAIEAGSIDADMVTLSCNKFSVENIGDLQDKPVLVPLVAKDLGL